METRKQKIIGTITNMFNIRSDMASYEEIHNTISDGAKLQGTNMCILMLAILVASVGLNMNSTAVIIGAMLISPLMGSIVGIGYGFATNNLGLSKKAAFRLCIQVFICVVTSTIYFALSPIKAPSSELLARTSPTAWDVIIAVCGGLAGVIGQTRKEKNNVIPGVAIATALMPPLCTAGYGIANLNLHYFSGAIYLFFINGFFICVTSIVVLKILQVPSYCELEKKAIKRIHHRITFIAVLAVLPSIYLAYQIAGKTIESSNVQSYIDAEFRFDGTQIVQSNIDTEKNTIEVALIGKKIDSEQQKELDKKLADYKLDGYELKITQTEVAAGVTKEDVQALFDKDNEENDTNVQQVILQNEVDDLNSENQSLKDELQTYKDKILDSKTLVDELSILFPQVKGMSGGNDTYYMANSESASELYIVNLFTTKELTDDEYNKITSWLQEKTGSEKVMLIVQPDSAASTDSEKDKKPVSSSSKAQ